MRNLLITTIGQYNHLSTWAMEGRDYDIAIIIYDNTPTPPNTYYNYVFRVNGFKYPTIKKVLVRQPKLLEYNYFWMPDEDILADVSSINSLFEKMAQFDVWLGQPSVSKDSHLSWPCFTHRPNADTIYSKFIEIMCPCFSRDALLRCLPVFDETQSGWGQDVVWCEIGKKENKAIINSVIVKHTRPVKGGELYSKLSHKRINPAKERKSLMRKYGIKEIII